MTEDIDRKATQAMLDVYKETYNKLTSADVSGRSRNAGHAAGLATDLMQFAVAQFWWDRAVPAGAGMPDLRDFRRNYSTHLAAFRKLAAQDTAFTPPETDTLFSHMLGLYSRALYIATHIDKAVSEDSYDYLAAHWGAQVLETAGFSNEAKRLNEAILKGNKLETAKGKSPQS